MPMISNFTPEAVPLLSSSAMYCRLLSWLDPSAAMRPDSGSIHATFTVSPFWAMAPVAQARARDAVNALIANFMKRLLLWWFLGEAQGNGPCALP